MALYCVDASAVLGWLLREEPVQTIRSFWLGLDASADRVISAELLRPECTSVIWENVSNGRLTRSDGELLIGELVDLPIAAQPSMDQYRMAFDLAARFGRRKAYDMQYVAVAELAGAELVTLDGGQRQAAMELRLPVRFLR